MNLILLNDGDFIGPTSAEVRGRALVHSRTVLRASEGMNLRVGRLGGAMGRARIAVIDEQVLRLEDIDLSQSPPVALAAELFIALPRPKLIPRLLVTATTLGIKQITFFNAYRVEKPYWSCEQLSASEIRRACLLGLEQAADTILPEVRLERLFKPFVQDRCRALIHGRRALVAHPYAEEICPYAIPEPLSLAIGPEGGFIPYELDLLEQAGFRAVRSLDRILRVEAALASLIGRLK